MDIGQTLLTIGDVRDIYGVAEYRVREAIKSGSLKSHVVGRRVLVNRHEFEKWVTLVDEKSGKEVNDAIEAV